MRYSGIKPVGDFVAIFLQRATPLLRRLTVGAVVYSTITVGSLLGRTAEPAHDFVDKLRERKYFDHAQEYLERLAQNPLATDDVKKTIPFELGVTYWAEAESLHDAVAREAKLDAAQQKLNEFLKAQPDHSLSPSAQSQLANISVERSTLLVARADRSSQDDKDKLLGEAREMLAQAEKIYTASYTQSRDELKKLQADTPSTDKEAIAKRDELRRQWVESRLKLADIDYQKSKASAAGSADQKRFLGNGAEKYAALADDFQNKLIGLQARVLEGICYQDLGERAKAIATYDNVLAVPEEADKDIRDLKTKALRQALECWVKDNKLNDAVTRATPWLTKPHGTEELEPDWLAGKFWLATAIEKQLSAGTTASTQRAAQLAQARRLAQDVARAKGEYQSEAVTLLAQLSKADAAADKKAEKTANTFEEANERVAALLDEISALGLQISLAESNKDPDQLKLVPDWKKQLAEKQGETSQVVRQALSLSKADSPSKDVNKLRYTLAYLLFNEGEYYDSAVISEYVARHYPDFDLAQACGEIALKSYVRLYQTSPLDKTKRTFEADRISSIANYLMSRWPTEPAAQEAVNWFLYLAVDRQQLDTAGDLLDKLPADSPARSEAEIRIGRILWNEYLKASRLKDNRPSQADLDKQLARAQATLESGVKAAMQRDSATPTIIDGVHALAQIYLDTAQANKAIALLENDKLGPLTLVNAAHPATQREGVPFEIYRTALRAYITAEPPRLADAAKVMDQLEKAAGNDAKASETLTAVYMAMGRDLQRDLEELRNRKDTAGMKTVAQAVEGFLKRIEARDKTPSFSTLNWIADTFYSLGLGFDPNDGSPPPQARTYYRQAVDAYQKLLSAVDKNRQLAPDANALLAVRLRLAICRRGIGEPAELKQAMSDFGDMLADNPKVRVIQAEAAKTYQAWGEKDRQYFKLAILGSNPDRKTGENTIWGWGKIAKILHDQIRRPNFTPEQQTEYRNWFHEARYQMCVCRFRYALSEPDKTEQKKQFELTKSDIALTYQLYPELGGDEWKPKYVALLKNVQKELGEPATGLDAIDSQKNAAKTSNEPAR